MARNSLRFVHADRPPATDELRVFDSLTRPFLGAEFTFRIVGSSHYISAPAYGFHELSSCTTAPAAPVDEVENDGDGEREDEGDETDEGGNAPTREEATIPLEPDRPSRRLAFETDALRCETVVDHRRLAAFPHERFRTRPESFDLAYAFDGDPEAVTTIELGADGYETYHTYPEFDLALYTRTVFTDAREGVALESAAAGDPFASRESLEGAD